MGLTRRERARDLCETYGAVWVETPAEMLQRMTTEQRGRLTKARDEQTALLEVLLTRGELSPRLDPALAACTAGEVSEVEERVAFARADRRLMRRALGLVESEPRSLRGGAVNVLSLCSGIGGLDIGLKIAVPGARVVAYVEGAASCQEVLLARMAEGVLDRAPVYGNVSSFDGKPWRGLVDCVAGGLPCQPFSMAGKRRGERDERHLWPHIRDRVLRRARPEWCLFENVEGHLSLGAPDVVRDLIGLGYRVALGLFPASELGAPHDRKRLFILAHADPHGQPPVQDGAPDAAGPSGGRAGLQGDGRHAAAVREGGQGAAPGASGVAAVGDPGAPEDGRPERRPLPQLRRPRWPGVWRRRWGHPCLWPPRRDIWPAWRGVRAVDPSLDPGVEEEGGRRRLNPAFVEQLMGFPRGWTDVPGLLRARRLEMLGNAVVPAAAALAWRELSAAMERGAREGEEEV